MPRCSTSSSRRRCKRRAASEVAFFPIHADFGPAKQEFHIGLGSSATPGMVPGLFAIHEALCRLPMKRLVEPAARAARAGFPLSAFQAYLFTVIAPILTASQGVARIFAPGGKPMKAGETFRNEELAETLDWLAEDGARLFVDGDVGQAIVAESRSLGGHLTHDDLKRYRVELREPLYWRHRRRHRRAQPAAGGKRRADRLRPRLSRGALPSSGRAIDAHALAPSHGGHQRSARRAWRGACRTARRRRAGARSCARRGATRRPIAARPM